MADPHHKAKRALEGTDNKQGSSSESELDGVSGSDGGGSGGGGSDGGGGHLKRIRRSGSSSSDEERIEPCIDDDGNGKPADYLGLTVRARYPMLLLT